MEECDYSRSKDRDAHFPESGTENTDSPKSKFLNGLLPEGQFPECPNSRIPMKTRIRAKAGLEQLPTSYFKKLNFDIWDIDYQLGTNHSHISHFARKH